MNLFKFKPLLDKKQPVFWWLLLVALALRLLAIFSIPFIDPSEARYAEIARKMWELQDWITPYHDYGIPFWAKPPLSTWVSALGMHLFGVNEFGARFPIFLISLAILGMVAGFACTQKKDQPSLLGVLVLLTSPLFYIASAAVMTDIPLLCATTLSMVAFWQVFHTKNARLWGYCFFVAQAIGLLAKGPLCFALTGLPLLLWVVVTGNFKAVWKKLPWISGTFLMIGLAVPWYILAELKTPGFLDYFIVGEHISRFLFKGWSGDLYGNAHPKTLGTIWVYWLGATFPWSIWLLGLCIHYRKSLKKIFLQNNWTLYLVLWTLCPLFFFTLSRNIIWTYVLPTLPPFALLLAHLISLRSPEKVWRKRTFILSTLLCPLVAFGICISSFYNPETLLNQKRLVRDFEEMHRHASLAYYCHNCYSASFYSSCRAPLLREAQELINFLKKENTFVAIRERKLQDVPPEVRLQLMEVGHYGDFILFKNTHTR